MPKAVFIEFLKTLLQVILKKTKVWAGTFIYSYYVLLIPAH